MSQLAVDAVTDSAPPPSEPQTEAETDIQPGDAALLDADLLIEDVSIDGMCGVY